MKYFIVGNGNVYSATNVAEEIKSLEINPEDFFWAELSILIEPGVIVSASSYEEAKKKVLNSSIKIQGGFESIGIHTFSKCGEISIEAKNLNQLIEESKNLWYNAGFGSQYLFGTITLKNGQWYEREEYDGLEGWKLIKPPKIPDWYK